MGKSVLMNLLESPKSKSTSLYYIVAFNDNYVLAGKTYHGQNSDYTWLNLFDRNFNFILDKEIRFTVLKQRQQKYEDEKREILNENVFKYFKECPELHEAMLKNVDNVIADHEGINYYNCGNSLDLLTNKKIKSDNINPITQLENKIEKQKIDFYVNTKGEKIEMVILNNDKQAFKKEKHSRIESLNPIFKYRTKLTIFNNIPSFKTESVPTEEVKYIYYENTIYGPVKQNGKTTLAEIFAFNNNYVLIGIEKKNKKKGYFYTAFQIYDRLKNEIIEETDENSLPFLKNYFGDCPDLLKLVDDNLKNHRGSVFGMTYYNCNNSKEFIEGGVQFE